MNPEEFITEAAIKLSRWNDFNTGAVWIGWWDGKIECCKDPAFVKDFVPVMVISEFMMKKGLSSKQWKTLSVLLVNNAP